MIPYKQIIVIILISTFLISCKNKLPSESNDQNKNATVDQKIENLLSQMTLEEKIGQMTQVDKNMLQSENDIQTYFLGSLLSGGGSSPSDNSASGWADMYDHFQSIAVKTRLHIPLIYGIDAVHGHNNVSGAVIFPHNIGMGCTNNPELEQKAAEVTAAEVAGTGIDWTFAPCIAVARNERWGRTYEGFGETPEITERMADAAVRGFQGTDLSSNSSIAACAKHFLGDGGTDNGIDQGNTTASEDEIRKIHLPGYIAAIKAGVKTVMISYSSINNKKMHGSKYWISDVLKGELGFSGLVVSDWGGVDQITGDYKTAVEIAVNAGIDMVMLPGRYKEFIQDMKELVNENKIPMERIDDAVKRILKVKYELNLFDKPYTDRSLTASVGSDAHRDVARECVRQSLVLLKNENNTLPLSKNISKILVAGKNANDLGNQCGGWTISWQGGSGETTTGTTIFQAVKKAVGSQSSVNFSIDGKVTQNENAAIVVIGEKPYAEGQGDRSDLSVSDEDINTITNIHNAGIPVVAVLISGRPMILNKIIDKCDAIVAAWLPGTEGEGVTDVLFGDYNFTGKLSHSWPKNMAQIPINFGDANYDPLFAYGYGLSY